MNYAIYLLTMLIGYIPQLAAETTAEKNRELNEVHIKMQAVGADLKTLVAEKNAHLEQLRKIEKSFGELNNNLFEIKAKIKQLEDKIQEIHTKIIAKHKEIQIQQHGLEGLLKSAYALGEKQALKLILNQRDPSVSGRILVYHNYISQARVQKLAVIQEDFKILQQLEVEKDAENDLLKTALEKKQQEMNALQTLINQREKLMVQIDADYQSKSAQMERLRHDEKKLESLLASLQKTDDNALEASVPAVQTPTPQRKLSQNEPEPEPSNRSALEKPDKPDKPAASIEDNLIRKPFTQLQGSLPWPVQGAISERFGTRRFETTWDGTVISAREGAEIHAIAAGRVVYADWLRGYGLITIVEHGSGYMSLYAYNQSLRKSAGDSVRAGEVLASVGRSGGRSQAALYFGIRKNGRPVDPEQWCRKSAKE